MGKLDKLLGGCGGYFREDEENDFPWDSRSGSGVWYSLFVVENGKIEKYGFTAAIGSKKKLSLALKEMGANDEAMLIGVWTGQYNTHLFPLDIQKAIKKLDALT